MLLHWIWFAHRPRLSDREKLRLLEYFQDPEDIYYADGAAYDVVPGLREDAKKTLKDKNLTGAEKILTDCRRERLQILTFQDAAYPARLQNIPDPPMVLYCKGQLPDMESFPAIGVVGTRKASAYGLQAAKQLGYQLGASGGIVVSGMALGIDALAMSGALTAGGAVIGVLGCGADMVYPPQNEALFRDVENYGCILSEFAPGTPPYGTNFPKRNRIISGLSNGVLVVEAPERSGALNTARHALEQGRDVFVVPGNIDQPSFVGSNQLLRDGAILASSGWEVLSEYEAQYPGKLHRKEGRTKMSVYPDEIQVAAQSDKNPGKTPVLKENLEKKPIDKNPSTPYSDLNTILEDLSTEEKAIVLALASGPRLVDEVIAETQIPAGQFRASQTMLAIRGILKSLPGNQITLK